MRGCLGVLVVMGLVTHARAQGGLDKPSFKASPAELLAAAKAAPRNEDIVVLREDHDISVDAKGLATSRWRLVIALPTQAGADRWDDVGISWNPSYQDKPTVRVRVIDPKGTSREVDPSLLAEDPAEGGEAVRRIHLPLPRLVAGSVLEEELVLADRAVLPGGGASRFAYLANEGPTLATRITVSHPAAAPTRVSAHNLGNVKPKVTTSGGRKTWRYDIGKLAPASDVGGFVPPDVYPDGVVGVSAASSWSAIAREYAKVVDKAIADGAITMPAKLPTSPTLDTVRAVTHWVHGMIAFSDEDTFRRTTMTPALPSDVIKRGRGDAKDTATLLAALLRQVGVRADLALVSRGPGTDVDSAVPALDVFDHVVVRAVVGTTTVWIDTGEAFAPAGQLGSSSQGRKALVIANDTTSLVATPSMTSKDNVLRELRTLALSETGLADVTEVSWEGGSFEPAQRAWIHHTSAAKVREALETYVDSEYANAELVDYKTTSPKDLSTPFELTVRARRSGRGTTTRDQIDVYVFPTDVLDQVPDVLTTTSADAKPRTFDVQLQRPYRKIIETRLLVPPGFEIPAVPPPKRRKLGPMTLVESRRIEKRELVIVFELDMVKSRFTPAEVAAIRTAIRELEQEGSVHLVLENIGASLLRAGKVREAIKEFERMIKMHPKEAVHHTELARAYLQVGAAAAARRAARKAIAIEPKNADAHVVLGWVLTHDMLGRRFTTGSDRKGARAAFEKARVLDPKHVGAANELAMLLERDAAGRRYEPGADLVRAAAAYKAAFDLDGDIELAYSQVRALLWGGKYREAADAARALAASEARDILLVAAVGAEQGGPEAIKLATSLAADSGARTRAIGGAAAMLFLVRSYDAMRDLFAETKAVPPGTDQARILAAIKRSATSKATSVQAVAIQAALGQLVPDRPSNVFWDKQVEADVRMTASTALAALSKSREVMTLGMLEDLFTAFAPFKLDGDAKAWRLEVTISGDRSVIYLAAERGVPKVLGLDRAVSGLGRYALRLLARKDEATAQRIFDWLEKDAPQLHGDFLARAFPAVWGAKLPRTRQAMELAAAVLAGESSERTVEIVDRCGATTTEGQFVCDFMLANQLRKAQSWGDLADRARAWAGRSKVTTFPATYEALALARTGRFDEAERVLEAALANHPDDRFVALRRVEISVLRGQLGEAVKRLRALADANNTNPMDHNNLAWLMLVEGSDLKGALAVAQKALALNKTSANTLHTLASIEVELGELGAAWDHGRASMDADVRGDNQDSIRYLHGRVLEELGLRDEAIAEYRAVKSKDASSVLPGSRDLAVRRLKALGVKP